MNIVLEHAFHFFFMSATRSSTTLKTINCLHLIAAFSRPFKEMYINILNVIIFTITGIFVGTLWFFYINTPNMAFVIVAATCDTLVILVLVSIILFRIPFARRLPAKCIFKGFKLKKVNISSHHQRAMLEGSFFQSCDEREPLLYSPT